MAETSRVAVILAGGSGTRFWPLSQPHLPKQYLTLYGTHSLIRQTYDRLIGFCSESNLFVCSTENQQALIQKHLGKKVGLILEPVPRNTGPAVLLCALELMRRGYSESTVMVVCPADHSIANSDAFLRSVDIAATAAATRPVLMTLGIQPSCAHTGYGYIESTGKTSDPVQKVVRFVEKPSHERAVEFLKTGRFYWNSGIFVWTLKSIRDAYRQFAPDLLSTLESQGTDLNKDTYQKLPAEPVDKMILEKSSSVCVVPAEMGWSDVGSWNALFELNEKTKENHVVISSKIVSHASSDCLVRAPNHQVALVGVKNLIVVVEGDKILICDRAKDQLVKEVPPSL